MVLTAGWGTAYLWGLQVQKVDIESYDSDESRNTSRGYVLVPSVVPNMLQYSLVLCGDTQR